MRPLEIWRPDVNLEQARNFGSSLLATAVRLGSGAVARAIGPRSQDAFRRAREVFPDGTTRVTIERDPIPRYVSHGRGAYLFDADGRRFHAPSPGTTRTSFPPLAWIPQKTNSPSCPSQ